ncbi:hypothetical protein F5Y18DRAFT_369631 [Xylariaceae sp. FL1019]|nr:hypothetical protein F5Y18DRAFT_369631 [Xylariaceae sp. FL1019]
MLWIAICSTWFSVTPVLANPRPALQSCNVVTQGFINISAAEEIESILYTIIIESMFNGQKAVLNVTTVNRNSFLARDSISILSVGTLPYQSDHRHTHNPCDLRSAN